MNFVDSVDENEFWQEDAGQTLINNIPALSVRPEVAWLKTFLQALKLGDELELMRWQSWRSQ